jgi:hypothetical protein
MLAKHPKRMSEHVRQVSRSTSPYRMYETAFIPSGFDQSGPTCEMYHSRVKERFPFSLGHLVMGLDYRRRTVSEGRRRVYGCEVQIFTVSLDGAKILPTPSHSSTPCG